MTTTTATISKATVLTSYALVQGEGKFALEVIGNPQKWVNPRLKEASATYSHSYLVNLKAIEARKGESVMTAFGDKDAIALEDFNFNMVKELIVHEGNTEPTLPISGEKVICNVAYAMDKKTGTFAVDTNGDKILEVRALQVTVASAPQSFASFTAKETGRKQVGAPAAAGDDKEAY